MLRWLARWLKELCREASHEGSVPAPPFKASKPTGVIMYGLWYCRLTPDQARAKATEWGFRPDHIQEMISQATQPPSYWSSQPHPPVPDAEPGAADVTIKVNQKDH
jgi:hypothetical protein